MILGSQGEDDSDEAKANHGLYLCSTLGVVKLYNFYQLLVPVRLSDLIHHLKTLLPSTLNANDFFAEIELHLHVCRFCPTLKCPEQLEEYIDNRYLRRDNKSPIDLEVEGGTKPKPKPESTEPVNMLSEFKQVTMEEMVQVLQNNNKKTCPTECPSETSA